MNLERRGILGGILSVTAWLTTRSIGFAAGNKGSTGPHEAGGQRGAVFHMGPIGRVEIGETSKTIRVFREYEPGLKGLEEFSHVVVLYWLDRNDAPEKRRILQVNPRGNKDNPLTGVFACRSPFRPNLIALSTCRILSIKDGCVNVDAIDAFDGTPILDIKPYIPALDAAERIRLPEWVTRSRE